MNNGVRLFDGIHRVASAFFLEYEMSIVAASVQANRFQGASLSEKPVVIVGTGPSGLRAAQKLHALLPRQPIIIYGDEPWAPYNRVRLSSFLSGEINAPELEQGWEQMDPEWVRPILGTLISRVSPASHLVQDFRGEYQYYSKLILATGSRPHIPSIPGVALPGVFTFRDLSDTHALMARRIRSRHTVVIGGGLLGLEVARAMQQSNTKVSIIDHSPRLMFRQLDDDAADMLREYVLSTGIRVYLGAGLKAIQGDGRVESVLTHRGLTLECDTVVLATGIVSNIDLARDAGLAFGRGIIVNDSMQTSAVDVYAVGECAEHRGQVYGLVEPGLEQAAVAAHVIAGGQSSYQGSIVASQLKVLGRSVFSMGTTVGDGISAGMRSISHVTADQTSYRKLVLKHGRLVGAIAYGSWDELQRVQQAIRVRKFIWPWQRLRFRRCGRVWPEHAADLVASWPADTRVCQCVGVTRGELCDAVLAGCESVECLSSKTGASTVCGSCKPLLQQFMNAGSKASPLPLYRTLLSLSLFSMALVFLFGLLPAFAPAQSVEQQSPLELLWTSSLLRQWTGFSLLALMSVAMLISARKRLKKFRVGDFNAWRLLHISVGLAMVGLLSLHTGLQMGQGINRLLLVSVLALMASGAIIGSVTALESFIGGRPARNFRSLSFWLHLLGSWPLPVLLGVHVLSVYYF